MLGWWPVLPGTVDLKFQSEVTVEEMDGWMDWAGMHGTTEMFSEARIRNRSLRYGGKILQLWQ